MGKKSGKKSKKIQESGKIEVNKLKDQLARSLADYDNLRKRVEKERDVLENLISARVVTRMLPVYDMLLDAQKHLQDQGVAMVLGEFEKTLKDEGIEKIVVEKGDKFDENLHEVVEVVKNGKKGEVAEVILTGWRLSENNQVIRPVKVKVYK